MAKRKPLSYKKRMEVFERDNFTCQYCGLRAHEGHLEVDHIIPVSKGGTDDMENLTTACRDCNRSKYNKDAKTFRRPIGYFLDKDENTDVVSSALLQGVIPLEMGLGKREATTEKQERNVNMASLRLENGRELIVPATPEGYAFLEKALRIPLPKLQPSGE